MPAISMTYIGETPSIHIARAQAIGIQQLVSVILALLAIENVGTAIRATTAGRIPRNIAATTLLSSNWRKNIAMANMMRNDGRAVPKQALTAPLSFFNFPSR